ncbi:uncharacterized protein LOC115626404 isoform X2 [Scaptodrosophila lebanonensis]|nr:uncharacterized protein LOC115626404 isoform X2 [Scaptodrosophila lebanonensis]
MSGIIVECHDVNNIDRIIQQDAFPLVQVRNQIDLKVNLSSSSPQSTPTIERQPSVILIGLDCMSRMNFQRTMPETAKFVKQQGWFEMQGYNKVTDGTLPNLLPILAGLKMGDLCSWRMPDCLDRQPWIWKAYKAAGYSTALADDVPSGGIFTTFSPGFLQVPVDHYLHTLLHGIAAFMKVYMRFGHSYCIGRRLSISYVFEFCTQFVQRYMEEHGRPVFGLFWTASFTHDHYYGASSLDAKFLEYMRVLEGHQLFEQAIVVLFSNQGARVGELVELSDGFLEERLPLLHIYLPAWFRNAYPKYAEALQLNRNRLCSNFDLHYTLQHILQLNAHEFFELPPLEKYPSSRSLLHPLPKDRSCEDAYIPEHWCTCNTFISVPKTGEMYLMAKVVVSHINGYLMKFYSNATCERLMLSDLEKCERKLIFEEDGRETMYGSIATFRLRFHTIPYGRFQATVFHNRETKFLERIHVPDVSRLSSYQNTSKCVQDKTAKKFCICRVYVPPQNQTTASRKVDKTAL